MIISKLLYILSTYLILGTLFEIIFIFNKNDLEIIEVISELLN